MNCCEDLEDIIEEFRLLLSFIESRAGNDSEKRQQLLALIERAKPLMERLQPLFPKFKEMPDVNSSLLDALLNISFDKPSKIISKMTKTPLGK